MKYNLKVMGHLEYMILHSYTVEEVLKATEALKNYLSACESLTVLPSNEVSPDE